MAVGQKENPDTALVKEIIAKQGALAKRRSFWDNGIWVDIAENFNIDREDMYREDHPGQQHGLEVYDGTPVSALNISSDGFYGASVSQSLTWMEQRLPQKVSFLKDVPEVNQWLQDSTRGLYAAYNNSNFYSEMRSFIRDGMSIGTATITVEKDKINKGIVFRTRHPNEGYIADNYLGQVDTYNRLFPMYARNIAQDFGRNNPAFSDQLKKAIKESPYTEFDILHTTFPRTDFDDSKLGVTNKRVASIHIEYSKGAHTDPHQQGILRNSGFDKMQSVTWRWFKNGSETYGRSPCGYALTDAERLQRMAYSHLRAGEYAADPAWNVPSEMQGKVRTNPHGMNYYGWDSSRVIAPIGGGVNYPISIDREDRTREQIEDHLNVKFFLTLIRAQKQITAEQVREMAGERAIIMSSAIGEFYGSLDRINDIVFQIEMDAGRIPAPPDILLEFLGGERIDTIYLGPLPQAQRRLFERQPIQEGLEAIAPLFDIFPETADVINPTRTAKLLLESANYPEEGKNTPEEIEDKREGRRVFQEQEAKKLDAERMAAVTKDLSQASKNTGKDINSLAEQVQV